MTEEYIVIELLEEAEEDIELSTEKESYPQYEGVYEVTSSFEKQTLETAYRVLTRDVVIEPIPGNYGRISYDGSTLTIT